MSDSEPRPAFTLEEMTVDTIDAATLSRKQSWLDTYVNEGLGVTKEWIEKYFVDKLSPDAHEARKERFLKGKNDGAFNAWVARSEQGEVIGSTTFFVKEDGTQELASIYVDTAWHGTGVGAQLIEKVIAWFDSSKPIELGVVTYNERAKAFYRKWGFEEIPNSETKFADLLPEIRMIRKPSNQQEGVK